MLSVIIPTFNRKGILVRLLEAFNRQRQSSARYEIIFIDDGSNDGTNEYIQDARDNSNIPIRYFFQQNKGPAAARNLGIKEARYPLLLFINDDTLPAENLIEQHLSWHKKWPAENIAVLGQALWAESLFVPIYARHYLVSRFEHLNELQEARPIDFITCNISVKKEFLVRYGLFDEDFPYAAHEDRELGYRLGKKGLCIKYNPQAQVYHYHLFQQVDSVLAHSSRLGQSLAIWEGKMAGERQVLYEFDLLNDSSLFNVLKERLKDVFFNRRMLPWWLWLIPKLQGNKSLTGYLYQHILGYAHREGYRYQKRVMNTR